MPELQAQRFFSSLSAEERNLHIFGAAIAPIPDANPSTGGQNAGMGLKLFHETGYSSILTPGETRVGLHPAWLVLAVSLWAGFAANVALWRALAGTAGGLGQALATGFLVAGGVAAALSLLGWRKTLKPAAILVLLVAGFVAASIWSKALPVDASLLSQKPSSLVVPSWASFLRWQVLAALAGLGFVPAIWVWRAHLRRLPASQQLGANVVGLLTGLAVAAASAYLIGEGPL